MSSPVFITNLVIYTGTDFAQTFVLEDYRSNTTMDLTGYTGRGHIKKYASESYAAEFSFYLALDPKTGRFSIEMLSAATSKLKPGSYLYDVILKDPSGGVTRAVEGTALVKKSVTKL